MNPAPSNNSFQSWKPGFLRVLWIPLFKGSNFSFRVGAQALELLWKCSFSIKGKRGFVFAVQSSTRREINSSLFPAFPTTTSILVLGRENMRVYFNSGLEKKNPFCKTCFICLPVKRCKQI